MTNAEAIVVGAGPYGLSTAASLQGAGVQPYVIGRAMEFWKGSMPKGMLLRSEIEASNIASPGGKWSFEEFGKATGRALTEPIPIDDFIAYGEWFQRQVAPDIDTRYVRRIAQNGSGFEVTMEDGEQLRARAVVLALGIGRFVQRPEQFAGIPRELAIHSSELIEPSKFAGKRVAVIGKGQSALESAALLNESGAQVEILTRGQGLEYLKYPWRRKLLRALMPGPLTPLSHKIFPPTDLGGIITSRTIADPVKFKRKSAQRQITLARSVTRPIGAYWLPSRIKGLRLKTGVTVTRAVVAGDKVKLELSDGTTTEADRVVLGTGYRIDVSKYDILDPALLRQVQTNDGYPVLSTGLETSVKGLYMAGVIGEKTLGPTLRFVTGTSNATPRLAAAIARNPR